MKDCVAGHHKPKVSRLQESTGQRAIPGEARRWSWTARRTTRSKSEWKVGGGRRR
ncbi:hypothetical protein E2C01_082338 [Portunus trituberculatus]|uniref:Uncharacterized protein n=1 Tax=Portunus trituberculatus TaxID=210409 RepID=A0A5B7J0K5_PORTR|nr:hypothetical protein [Portunus trituberculatus]